MKQVVNKSPVELEVNGGFRMLPISNITTANIVKDEASCLILRALETTTGYQITMCEIKREDYKIPHTRSSRSDCQMDTSIRDVDGQNITKSTCYGAATFHRHNFIDISPETR